MRVPVPETILPAERLGRVHFVGIGGAGLSAIARLMLARGITVSGSDGVDSGTLDKLREAGAKPIRREGHKEGRWVLLDYGEIVVHVQHEEERSFYALERLWSDCPLIPLTLA